jgi:tRNA U34 5-methylaminomethyl-2-thiouridine-forming methyltransferase MnmC
MPGYGCYVGIQYRFPRDSLVQFVRQSTEDGSITYFSPEFEETFHSEYGAVQEVQEQFIEPCGLLDLARRGEPIRLINSCYGLGYNSAAAIEAVLTTNPTCPIEIYTMELDPLVIQQASQEHVLSPWPLAHRLLGSLPETTEVQSESLTFHLLLGDARQRIADIPKGWANAVFHDPFSPTACPELWTVEFFQSLAQTMAPEGVLSTYSSSAAARKAMLEAGFTLGTGLRIGRRAPSTIADFGVRTLPELGMQEQEHLLTSAAVPYCDPDLNWNRVQIKEDRKRRQAEFQGPSSNQWRKRWLKSRLVP